MMHFVSADMQELTDGSDAGGTNLRGPTGYFAAAAMQSSSSGTLYLMRDSFYIW